jgi:hydroxymethylbilane synthase
MMTLTAATRSSPLALAQTQIVIDALKNIHPDLKIKIKTITTKGDRDKTTALWRLKGYGFFTSQLEHALLDGHADFAVHSFKDMPTESTPHLTIAAVPERNFPEDVMVAGLSSNSLQAVPPGAKIGTSSPRRLAQLKYLRPDLNIVPIRGNVHTRVEKLQRGDFDAIVLARAGLERLSLAEKISFVFDPDVFIPAPAQGALAVQTKNDRQDLNKMLAMLNHDKTRLAVQAERTVLARLHPGCHAPVGVFAKITDSDIMIRAFVAGLEGEKYLRKQAEGKICNTEKLVEALADELIKAGADKIIERLKINERN